MFACAAILTRSPKLLFISVKLEKNISDLHFFLKNITSGLVFLKKTQTDLYIVLKNIYRSRKYQK